jgi:hypothetical protein
MPMRQQQRHEREGSDRLQLKSPLPERPGHHGFHVRMPEEIAKAVSGWS